MYRFVSDQFFQDIGGCAPIDAPQLKKATVKPARQQMLKIAIDGFEARLGLQQGQQIFAHVDHRTGAAGGHVDAPDHPLTHRFRRHRNVVCGGRVGVCLIRRDGLIQYLLINIEVGQQGGEEGTFLIFITVAVGIDHGARQRRP